MIMQLIRIYSEITRSFVIIHVPVSLYVRRLCVHVAFLVTRAHLNFQVCGVLKHKYNLAVCPSLCESLQLSSRHFVHNLLVNSNKILPSNDGC